MKNTILLSVLIIICLAIITDVSIAKPKENKQTVVSIKGDKFLINGKFTYKGRSWQGYPIEGLLMNSRMVQGIFDGIIMKPQIRNNYSWFDNEHKSNLSQSRGSC